MSNLSRRNLTKGAAWAVPGLTIAAAAPSLAASDSGSVNPGLSHGTRCQGAAEEGEGYNKGYRIFLAVEPAGAPAPVLVSASNENGDQTVVAGPLAVEGNPGVYEYVVEGDASANFLTINYTIGDGPLQTVSIPTSPHCGGYKY